MMEGVCGEFVDSFVVLRIARTLTVRAAILNVCSPFLPENNRSPISSNADGSSSHVEHSMNVLLATNFLFQPAGFNIPVSTCRVAAAGRANSKSLEFAE